jgi:AraC-like DNA-binding protein
MRDGTMKKRKACLTGKEKARMWRAADLAGLECIQATYISQVFPRHTHESFAIGLIEAGVQATDYRGATYYASAGDICLVNPGEAHTGYAPDEAGWTYQCSYPVEALLQKAAEEVADRAAGTPYFPSPVIQDPSVARLLQAFFVSLQRPHSALEQESRLLAVLARMIARYSSQRPDIRESGRERGAVRRVRDYIHDHYPDNMTLVQLAAVANLSRFHLIRVFQKETGLSPHAYLTQVRVEKAKELLARNVPIVHTALAVGFSDQSHLTRRFKSITGIPPGQYAQIRNNVQDSPSLSQ